MTAKITTQTGGRPSRPPVAGRFARVGNLGLAAGLAASCAALSLVAALIHLWVAPEHFEEWWGYGAFMVISAACQGLFVPLVLRWPKSRLISLAGIAGNLSIVLLYVVTYTWGMPFGPTWVPFDPAVAHIETPGLLGTSATVAEAGIVMLLAASLEGSLRRVVIDLLLLAGALLWALRIVGVLP